MIGLSPYGDKTDTPLVTFPIPLLIEAITSGGFYIGPSDIYGHCGYRGDADRVIALNPEAPPDQLADELADHLRALAAAKPTTAATDPPEPGRLSLVHSVDRPEAEPPDADSDPRVVG